MNLYLKGLRERYDSLRKAIEGLQARAAEQNRDLSDEELRSVREMSDQAQTLHKQIEDLTEVEVRNAKVAALQARLALAQADADDAQQADADGDQDDADDQNRSVRLGGATTSQRDPGHYRADGQHSFFADLVRARAYGDEAAQRRLTEHMRALDSASDGAGVLPPRWLAEEYAEVARQGRAVANAVRRFPISDPRPLLLPKQTGTTDSDISEQESENDPTNFGDSWASDYDTVTPVTVVGGQEFSRQLLDMSTPSIDRLLYEDLLGAYNDRIEAMVADAIMAVGTPLQAVEGAGVAVTDPQHFAKVAVRAAMAVRQARKRPPTIWLMSVGRYGEFLNLTDTTGRPLIPDSSGGPVNVAGVGTIQAEGTFRGLPIIPTEGVDVDDEFAAVRSSDVLLFESPVLQFRYEQPKGPETIRLGIWSYAAVTVRYGAAVKRVAISEESPS